MRYDWLIIDDKPQLRLRYPVVRAHKIRPSSLHPDYVLEKDPQAQKGDRQQRPSRRLNRNAGHLGLLEKQVEDGPHKTYSQLRYQRIPPRAHRPQQKGKPGSRPILPHFQPLLRQV